VASYSVGAQRAGLAHPTIGGLAVGAQIKKVVQFPGVRTGAPRPVTSVAFELSIIVDKASRGDGTPES
jgi:hypothetical protein